MKKTFLSLLLTFILFAFPVSAATKPAVKAGWKPAVPTGYKQITWASAPGIVSYFKKPNDNGTLDFLTRIYLPQNQIKFIASSTAPIDNGRTDIDTAGTYNNLSFARLGAETAKEISPDVKFIWDAPFFNMKPVFTDLSMALKSTFGTTTTITSGSRSVPDMNEERHMLIINNQTGKASIGNFDAASFLNNNMGDQAIEGFAPTVAKSDNANGAAARLFLGVSSDGKELIVYCSKQATVGEASAALSVAGVSLEHQLEADGGGSASCGYNLPGQYFVEPTRTLPVLMGAATIMMRGTVPGASLNVRGGPGTKYPVVNKLSKGAMVQAFEEKNGWVRIGIGQWVLKILIKAL